MASIEFTWDSRDLKIWRTHAVNKALTSAVSKAGSDAARFLKSGSSRLLRQRKRFKAGVVSKGLPLLFPRGSRDLSDLVWRMDVSGKPVPVSAFPFRQTKKGVSVAINTGKRVLIKSAFVATMRSGHTGIFLRTSKKRLPIREAFTTKISDVFLDRDFIPFVQAGAQAKFKASFDRLFKVELDKMRR